MSLKVVSMAGCSVSVDVEHFLYALLQFCPFWPSRAARMYLKNRRISTLSEVGLRNSFSSLWSRKYSSIKLHWNRYLSLTVMISQFYFNSEPLIICQIIILFPNDCLRNWYWQWQWAAHITSAILVAVNQRKINQNRPFRNGESIQPHAKR